MKRIQRGPVRGISLKLQEEERERRMDFIPERSILDVDTVEIDNDTKDMLQSLSFPAIQGVTVQSNMGYHQRNNRNRDGYRRDRKDKD